MLDQRYLKLVTLYLFGTHTFSEGEWSKVVTTKAVVEIPSPKGNPIAYLDVILDEVTEDVTGSILRGLLEWIRGNLGGNHEGNADE